MALVCFKPPGRGVETRNEAEDIAPTEVGNYLCSARPRPLPAGSPGQETAGDVSRLYSWRCQQTVQLEMSVDCTAGDVSRLYSWRCQ